MNGRSDVFITRGEASFSDAPIEQEIDRIVALRAAAEAGDAAARSALGPDLDSREAELWSALRAIREEIAMASLRRAGLIDDDGRASVSTEVLRAHLDTLIERIAVAEAAASAVVLPVEMGRTNIQIARRERARILAEMTVVRRLLAAR